MIRCLILSLAALGAAAQDLQVSARLVAVTAVVGLLAPLFWPGRADTGRLTAARSIGWSLIHTTVASNWSAVSAGDWAAEITSPRLMSISSARVIVTD